MVTASMPDAAVVLREAISQLREAPEAVVYVASWSLSHLARSEGRSVREVTAGLDVSDDMVDCCA